MLMNPNQRLISNVLDYLTKYIEKNTEDDFEETKTKFGIEKQQDDDKIIFFLVKCKIFGGKSLLWYIDSQNVRLHRQREELIDLSVKISGLNHGCDTKKAIEEVINNYKSGLPSGVGLRDMIEMIKERYPWSTSKMISKTFVSLVTCLMGIGLYVSDLTTDLKFSLEMLNGTVQTRIDSDDLASCFKNISHFPSCQTCLDEHRAALDNADNKLLEDVEEYYKLTGWFAVWHCIQPFVFTFIVFLMNQKKWFTWEKLCEPTPDDKEYQVSCFTWHCINAICCCLPILGYIVTLIGSVLPIPFFTNLYSFLLERRYHIARTKPDFKARTDAIEVKIEEHEALGKFYTL